jgi:endonuclease YncB( thermonuclease family)
MFRLLRTLFRLLLVFTLVFWLFRWLGRMLSRTSSPPKLARPGALEGQTWQGRVTRVIDGDTVWADFGKGPLRIRFAHIDAPEHGQRGGEEATAWMNEALGDDRLITAHPYELDYFGRVVADVYHGEARLNYWTVKTGLAWALPDDGDQDVAQAQTEAQAAQVGIWTERYPTPPWVWRKSHQEGAA